MVSFLHQLLVEKSKYDCRRLVILFSKKPGQEKDSQRWKLLDSSSIRDLTNKGKYYRAQFIGMSSNKPLAITLGPHLRNIHPIAVVSILDLALREANQQRALLDQRLRLEAIDTTTTSKGSWGWKNQEIRPKRLLEIKCRWGIIALKATLHTRDCQNWADL